VVSRSLPGAYPANVYAGLAGFYLIRDEAERALNLPQGEFEIPLMLQDRLFHHDGSLYYPKVVNGPAEHPIWIQEFFGDMNCVNGKVMPFLEVEPRNIVSVFSMRELTFLPSAALQRGRDR